MQWHDGRMDENRTAVNKILTGEVIDIPTVNSLSDEKALVNGTPHFWDIVPTQYE